MDKMWHNSYTHSVFVNRELLGQQVRDKRRALCVRDAGCHSIQCQRAVCCDVRTGSASRTQRRLPATSTVSAE